MKVVITGGTGFIGARLARRILEKGSLAGPGGVQTEVDEVVLFDVVAPDSLPMGLDGQVTMVAGDISDTATVDRLVDRALHVLCRHDLCFALLELERRLQTARCTCHVDSSQTTAV